MFRLTKTLVRRDHSKCIICRLLHLSKFYKTQENETLENEQQRKKFQVTIIGVNPVAQSLSLLLKEHPFVSRIVLYDRPKSTYGVGLDLSHIPSHSVAEGRAGHIGAALYNADIVCLACGELRKPGQTDYNLFKTNADLLIHPVKEICRHCPKAFVVDITEPINYTVPLITRVMQSGRAYDKSKVLGVTGIDSMRAQARLHQLYEIPEQFKDLHIPVICGHSASTAVPLVSHVRPWISIDSKAAAIVIEHVRESANSILQSGSHQTSQLTAYAGVQVISAILNALNDAPDAQIAFVSNDTYKTKFFASPVKITKDGITDIVDFKVLSNIEQTYLHESIQELACDVDEADSYYKDICHKLT